MRALAVLILMSSVAGATPPEPAGPHPRMLLDNEVRTAWREQAKANRAPIAGAIALCREARATREHDHAQYQGSEWAKVLQACLVAWAATDDKIHADTAIRFFTALLDDLDDINDLKGGNNAASRDSGYAIRNLGPYTALAYDWLHDQMSDELRARARARWKAWLGWYAASGYRAHTPPSNYYAGYLLSATAIAIAEAGEAGGDGKALWGLVADTMWGKEMAAALGDGGVLAGGDWPEGWQYGNLSTAELALAARLARGAGIPVDGAPRWLDAVLKHHVYALSPADGMYPGGDADDAPPNIKPGALEMAAVALGDASPDAKRWARGELSRLQLEDRNYLVYDALASIGDKPVLPPRASWPTWYVSENTGTLYARTRWDDRAMWVVFACHSTIDTDHRHADAGNFAVSRGRDDVIVDPTPYGATSTLTSNAPTVVSPQLPGPYQPSQGYWSEKTQLELVTQRASGIVAARCNYADQYKFQEHRSDIPMASRDLVMIPSEDGRDAVVLVIDRASTRNLEGKMHLRFRTPGHLALNDETATATVGGTSLTIASVSRSSGKAAIGVPTDKDCFKQGVDKGKCDAARFPVTDYRVELSGPEPRAVHAISFTDPHAPAPAVTALTGTGWAGASVAGPRPAVVVWRASSGTSPFTYTAPRGSKVTHVIFDAAFATSAITAKADGDHCAVQVGGRGSIPSRPAVLVLDDHCAIAQDPEAPSQSAISTHAPASSPHDVRAARSGCCGAQATPSSPIAIAVVVIGMVLRRRRQGGARRLVIRNPCDRARSTPQGSASVESTRRLASHPARSSSSGAPTP